MWSSKDNADEGGLRWGKWKVSDDTCVLTNRWGNFCYLLLGSEKAMLIDTGYGEGNIREIAEDITDLPIVIVNTHGHCDHVGGNFYWNECCCGVNASADVASGAPQEFLDYFWSNMPKDFIWHEVGDGDAFELGGRKLEVFSMQSHATSGIALLDKKNRWLFTGDEIDPGQVLLDYNLDLHDPEELFRAHLKSVNKLLERKDEFDHLCPAHNGLFISPDYLEEFKILDEALLAGTANKSATPIGFNWTGEGLMDMDGNPYREERAQYKNASLVWRG